MSASDPPSSDRLVGTVLGRHVLTRLLGEGGMGAVYEGTHQELGRRAAVKTLHERYARSSDVRQRFLREGQAASQVRHPNVVQVYDVGVQENQPYLVMEFLEGEDLGRLIVREGTLSTERTADLLLPVIAAVAAAHDQGVVHRDLKPENIFLSSERGGIKPKVLDFGISKLVNRDAAEPLTGTGAFLGTPHYMSPEQAQGAKYLDHRSDQYSLGVILYLCSTGRRPVDEPSLYALIQRIVRGEFPPPRQLNPELPATFEAVILRAMAREPDERFPTTRALGRALLDFASARLRAQQADEFTVDPLSPTALERPPPPVDSLEAGPVGLGTTLGESVHQRDLQRPPGITRRWLVLGGLAASVAAGLFAFRRAGTEPAGVTTASAAVAAAPEPQAATPSPPWAVEPKAPQPLVAEAVTPAASAAAVVAGAAGSGGVGSLKPPARRRLAASSASARAVSPDHRPSLAPR